jgi:hypothetical protein
VSDIVAVVRVDPPIRLLIDNPQTITATINQGQPGPAGATGPEGPAGPAGAAGPPIVNTGTYASPTVISGTITVPSDQRARVFITADQALRPVTSIGNGSGTQELYLYGVSGSLRVQLTNLSNLVLSGEWQSATDSQLCLHWITGASKWVEAGRNEI